MTKALRLIDSSDCLESQKKIHLLSKAIKEKSLKYFQLIKQIKAKQNRFKLKARKLKDDIRMLKILNEVTSIHSKDKLYIRQRLKSLEIEYRSRLAEFEAKLAS